MTITKEIQLWQQQRNSGYAAETKRNMINPKSDQTKSNGIGGNPDMSSPQMINFTAIIRSMRTSPAKVYFTSKAGVTTAGSNMTMIIIILPKDFNRQFVLIHGKVVTWPWHTKKALPELREPAPVLDP